MKKIMAIILILAGLAAGYLGIDKLESSSAGIKIGDFELRAEDRSSKTSAYLYLSTGVVCLIAGVYLVNKKP